MTTGPLFLGVDVGTGSARAGLFDASGRMLAAAKRDIRMWREAGSVVEQSSDDIWQAVCAAVREAVADAAIDPAAVAGIGFDATCSLVLLGPGGQPVTVSPSIRTSRVTPESPSSTANTRPLPLALTVASRAPGPVIVRSSMPTTAPPLMLNTRLWWLPLTASSPVPGPSMVRWSRAKAGWTNR